MRRNLLMAACCVLVAGPAAAKADVYLSLMGEPFWTNEKGEAPFDQWLDMVDRDSDGAVSKEEFLGDATAFFESLDLNDDQSIDGAEMTKYEQLAPGKTRADGGAAVRPSSARPNAKPTAPVEKGMVAIVATGDAPSATRIHPGGGPINYAEVPQPVAMADRDLNGRVSLQEFRKTAEMRFSNYDTNKDGKLTAKELR